jgi:nitroreductase
MRGGKTDREDNMFLDLLKKRRSIRRFIDKPVEQATIDLLLEAALRSPSSRSLNPWHFIVVQDRETISRLSQAKPHGATFMKNAPLAIVICAEPERCDVWIEDCSIASIHLHLMATDLGLGSCWVQIRLREHDADTSAEAYIRELLDLPKSMMVESIMAIGYPAEDKQPHPRSTLLYERIHQERFRDG